MAPRAGVLAVLAVALAAPADALAHAVLLRSTPPPGATLAAAPATVRLTFTERPEPALSQVTVTAPGGRATAAPRAGTGDTTLSASVGAAGKGVYTVRYRVVSEVDGHVTSGVFAFGVGVSPAGAQLRATSGGPATSTLEVLARWLLLVGLALLLGTAVAAVARYGRGLRLATAGWLFAVAGLLLLTEAQRRSAGVPLGDFLDTSVGDALVARAVAIAAAGIALLLAAAVAGRVAPALTAAAALAAIAVHVAAGHAAAGPWPSGVTITAQAAHVAAAGVWLGGLAALLLFARGAPSAVKAAGVRRFSLTAGGALAAVLVTGTVRAVDELNDAGELFTTGYGRAILAKIVLFGVLAALGLRNRRRSVPAAAADLAPLQRTSRRELGLAAITFAVAALLGALAPPVGESRAAPGGLSATGEAGGVRVKLTALSAAPGPNVFRAEVEGAEPAALPLRFTPLDDPAIAPTTLTLRRAADGRYEGAGKNLRFDGRWAVDAAVGGATVRVELDVPGPETVATITEPPNAPVVYSVPGGALDFVQLTVFPRRPGRSHITASRYDELEGLVAVRSLVLTMQVGDGPVRQLPVRRAAPETFATDVELPAQDVRFAVVLRTPQGERRRATFDVKLSAGS